MHNASNMENASWVMVTSTGLIQSYQSKTLIHICRLGRGINHHPRTSAQPCSRPGKHPPNAHLRGYSLARGNTHQPCRSPTAHLRGYILARGNTHQPRIYTATQCGCRRASGASQMGNPLHDGYVFPAIPVSTASRCSLLGAGIPLLVGGSNPLSGL